MSYHPLILVDTGILVAFYNRTDKYHSQVIDFFAGITDQLITTVSCITETMHLLPPNWKIQNQLLLAVAQGVFECEHLQPSDFVRIAELNTQYADLPGDFLDLALVAISERLDIPAIATLDSDFDVYRRYRKKPFERVFWPS